MVRFSFMLYISSLLQLWLSDTLKDHKYRKWLRPTALSQKHVRGFFDTDLHEVSWHFSTHEAVDQWVYKFNWPIEIQCQISYSKWVFVLSHT